MDNDKAGLTSGFLGPLQTIFNARVSSQAERAQLELSLLIRADDKSFSRMSDQELLSVFDVEEFDGLQEKASALREALARSDKLQNGEALLDHLEFLSKPRKKMETIDSARQKRIPNSEASKLQNIANQVQLNKET